jgi:hypothetical protein
MKESYREGRCRMCGRRVTVGRDDDSHLRNGALCGPVETELPGAVPDEPPPCDWVYASSVPSCDV